MTATTKTRQQLFGGEEPEWLVWVLVIILLGIGLIAKTVVTGQNQTVGEGSITLKIPAAWAVLSPTDNSEVLRVSEPFEASLFPAAVAVKQMAIADMSDDPQVTLGDLALKWSNRQARDLQSYKVLAIEPVKIKGQDAVAVTSVYVTEPALATPNSIPIVAEGQDVLFRQGDSLTIVSFLAEAGEYEAKTRTWNRILSSLELK